MLHPDAKRTVRWNDLVLINFTRTQACSLQPVETRSPANRKTLLVISINETNSPRAMSREHLKHPAINCLLVKRRSRGDGGATNWNVRHKYAQERKRKTTARSINFNEQHSEPKCLISELFTLKILRETIRASRGNLSFLARLHGWKMRHHFSYIASIGLRDTEEQQYRVTS